MLISLFILYSILSTYIHFILLYIFIYLFHSTLILLINRYIFHFSNLLPFLRFFFDKGGPHLRKVFFGLLSQSFSCWEMSDGHILLISLWGHMRHAKAGNNTLSNSRRVYINLPKQYFENKLHLCCTNETISSQIKQKIRKYYITFMEWNILNVTFNLSCIQRNFDIYRNAY